MSSVRFLQAGSGQRLLTNYLRPTMARFFASTQVTNRAAAATTKDVAEEPSSSSAESELPVTFVEDEDQQAEREARIEQLRNKSRLLPQHRNMLLNKLPYEESQSWIHETVKYKRTMLGRYGVEGSRVDPRVCFPTRQEALEKAEYERVAYPYTLSEMMATNQKAKQEKVAKVKAREEEIARKMEKLDHWVADLNARVTKKETEARAAKERKDRLVEEVRRHFGFKIDPRDERFQEMLAQKEKEDRKKVKEAKRKEKEVKMMEKLKKKTAELEGDSPKKGSKKKDEDDDDEDEKK